MEWRARRIPRLARTKYTREYIVQYRVCMYLLIYILYIHSSRSNLPACAIYCSRSLPAAGPGEGRVTNARINYLPFARAFSTSGARHRPPYPPPPPTPKPCLKIDSPPRQNGVKTGIGRIRRQIQVRSRYLSVYPRRLETHQNDFSHQSQQVFVRETHRHRYIYLRIDSNLANNIFSVSSCIIYVQPAIIKALYLLILFRQHKRAHLFYYPNKKKNGFGIEFRMQSSFFFFFICACYRYNKTRVNNLNRTPIPRKSYVFQFEIKNTVKFAYNDLRGT